MWLVFIAWLYMPALRPAMDQPAADRLAAELWGGFGRAWRVRVITISGPAWEYQVGCQLPDQRIIAGRGASWEEAFKRVDRSRNGPRTTAFGLKLPVRSFLCQPSP